MGIPIRFEAGHTRKEPLQVLETESAVGDDVVPRSHQLLLGQDGKILQRATLESLVETPVEGGMSVGKPAQACELSLLAALNACAAPPFALAQGASAGDERQNPDQVQAVDRR